MASSFVIREESALPNKMKVTVLAQELVRRERNTCRNVSKDVRQEISYTFLMKLRKSGYSTRHRLQIMISCLRGYQKMCDMEYSGGRKINRTRKEQMNQESDRQDELVQGEEKILGRRWSDQKDD